MRDDRERLAWGHWREGPIPISYDIDTEHGLVLSVGRGVVTPRDLFDYLGAQAADPAVPLPLRDLHDLSRVERLEVERLDMQRVVELSERNPQHIQGARLAIVAPEDHVYGTYRMFELLSEHAPVIDELRRKGIAPAVAVFRRYEEAREWLLSADGEPPPPPAANPA